MNFTFFMLKPDVIDRNIIGPIVTRIEVAGFRVRALKMLIADSFRVYEHYKEHSGKPFFKDLCEQLVDNRVIVGAAVYTPDSSQSIVKFRELIGPFDPRIPGTLRGDFAINFRQNSIHAADSRESAMRELMLWLPEDL